jgi:hypothetical protein
MTAAPKCWPVTFSRPVKLAFYVLAGFAIVCGVVAFAGWNTDASMLYADRMRIASMAVLYAWVISGVIYWGLMRWMRRRAESTVFKHSERWGVPASVEGLVIT